MRLGHLGFFLELSIYGNEHIYFYIITVISISIIIIHFLVDIVIIIIISRNSSWGSSPAHSKSFSLLIEN